MKYLIARKKKKVGKYWTYMTDTKRDKFLKFSEKQAKNLVEELKQENKTHNFKIVAVKE